MLSYFFTLENASVPPSQQIKNISSESMLAASPTVRTVITLPCQINTLICHYTHTHTGYLLSVNKLNDNLEQQLDLLNIVVAPLRPHVFFCDDFHSLQ